MSKNDTIRKSDKKFIRHEKARIRRDFLDSAKQRELINELYKRFVRTEKPAVVKTEAPKSKLQKTVKTEKIKTKKAKV